MSERERVARVVRGVIRRAMQEAGAGSLIVLADDTPEGHLVYDWSESAIGAERVQRASELMLPWKEHENGDAGIEFVRVAARVRASTIRALLAHPANKTDLLLGDSIPPEPLLPLGDLYASRVMTLCGDWSASAPVRRLAEMAGGVARLDRVLMDHFEGGLPLEAALEAVASDVRSILAERLRAGRFGRRHVGLVPKLGSRTLGIDLFS